MDSWVLDLVIWAYREGMDVDAPLIFQKYESREFPPPFLPFPLFHFSLSFWVINTRIRRHVKQIFEPDGKVDFTLQRNVSYSSTH